MTCRSNKFHPKSSLGWEPLSLTWWANHVCCCAGQSVEGMVQMVSSVDILWPAQIFFVLFYFEL
uniref:Uncharacterized protein n=1 Tax=Anguilla anguilla TaxID=7936 RepID=A0A0E9WPI9_ANGAN